ncbi:hypothetical protein LSTR_LSTR003169 [Laodelphax striatellus]|uniref:Uncharacterized protein n=1 Tax=Laodelphax striatellus TaxID=195883 RepID=A0A482WVN9_LAOST|nr:hypothetical protein LSTR_LSTR003169 [Laodelphax striatellus]
MKMVLTASIVIHNFVSSYSPIGEIISLKRRKLLLPGGHCLFGAPNPEETTKLINDQLVFDRQRMLDQYDFDIVTNSNSEKADLKTVTNNNNNNDVDENVLKRIRGEDGAEEKGEEKSKKNSSENDLCNKFNEGLHKVRKGAAFKRQSHLTDFWRSKRRAWESSTSKGKLGTESSSTWKTYCMKSIQ